MSNTATKNMKGGMKAIQTYMHPEIQKRLKLASIEDDVTMAEKLHAILCHEFDRLDLLQQAPDHVAASA